MMDLVNKATELRHLQQRMIEEVQDYAIVLLDKDGVILTWNKGVEQIKGYRNNEIIGRHFEIFYLPHDRRAGLPRQLLELARREGRATHIGRRLRKDGSSFWGSIVITALHNNENEVIGFTKLTRELRNNEIE